MNKDIIYTYPQGERVTSTYADIYLDDSYCEDIKIENDTTLNLQSKKDDEDKEYIWTSPSDLLTNIIELVPPFTSKINRAITHKGILEIGENVLQKERERFLDYLKILLQDNDSVWISILDHEKTVVDQKVRQVYKEILSKKTKTMQTEMSKFYENTLQELQDNVRSEVMKVLLSTHAQIVSNSNMDIKSKLKKERIILEKKLQEKYYREVCKVRYYYKLLLDNEEERINTLINHATHERNDALKAFYRQLETENITSTMYILCTERKKCRIRQFLMENYQTAEISEKYQKIKDREEIIKVFKSNEHKISDINQQWEDKLQKVLVLFLKFISYSLKLLPEQSTFLIDFEKMFILQLNELKKSPHTASSILVDEDKYKNIFQFECPEPTTSDCIKHPFVIEGDLSSTPPPEYGSRETLPPEAELSYLRLQRKFIYAKCNKFEEVKELLESQRCKCADKPSPGSSKSDESTPLNEPPLLKEVETKTESSNESLLVDDLDRLYNCPARNCQDWIKRGAFPYLNAYLDFTEENFARVKTIIGKPNERAKMPKLLDPKDIVNAELQFAATREPYHHVGTQYSSEEDLCYQCPCTEQVAVKYETQNIQVKSPNKVLQEAMTRRRHSVNRILQQNPKLLQIFTDESFDYQM